MTGTSSRTDGRTRESIRAKEYNRIMTMLRWGEVIKQTVRPYAIGMRVMVPDGRVGRVTHHQESFYSQDIHYYFVFGECYRHDELQCVEPVLVAPVAVQPLPFDVLDDWIPPSFRVLEQEVRIAA